MLLTNSRTSSRLTLTCRKDTVGYTERLMAAHETVILSYHLKKNLWIDGFDGLMLEDDLSADLDVAMLVRREGVDGQRTPDGILTRLNSTTIGRLITSIENRAEPVMIDLGFLLLAMSEQATLDGSLGIDRAAKLALGDGKTHDISVGFQSPNCGLTVHCSTEPIPLVEARLRRHCELRKYREKARTWFGLCLHPGDRSVRFGFTLDYEWQQDADLDRMPPDSARPATIRQAIAASQKTQKLSKVGRNDPCPCGSGRKYKKCHGQ